MVIAIDARFLTKPAQNATNTFLLQVLQQVMAVNTQHRFLFISDQPLAIPVRLPANAVTVIAGPVCKNRITHLWWQRFTLPRLLKKHKAGVYFSQAETAGLYTPVPQYLLVTDINALAAPEHHPGTGSRIVKQLSLLLQKGAKFITLSENEKKIFLEQDKLSAAKVTVIKPFISEQFTPLPYDQKKQVKETYTNGCEYFFFSGSLDARNNLLGLLKAFSKFKKRQQSNWKLVIAADSEDKAFMSRLQTYKHKDDVVLLTNIPEPVLAGLTAAAYAFTGPVHYEGISIHPLQAMQCKVPVISSIGCNLYTLAPDAALYVDPDNIDDIAQQMMLLYKDENLCRKLSEKAGLFAGSYNNPLAAEQLWQTITE